MKRDSILTLVLNSNTIIVRIVQYHSDSVLNHKHKYVSCFFI